jgi:hypothetical protein
VRIFHARTASRADAAGASPARPERRLRGIYAAISSGANPNSKMAGFKKKMPDQDLWGSINYLRSLGPKPAVR